MEDECLARADAWRPVYSGQDSQAVEHVGEEHAIGRARQPGRLGRIEVDSGKRGRGQKRAADGEYALDPVGRLRLSPMVHFATEERADAHRSPKIRRTWARAMVRRCYRGNSGTLVP